MINPLTRCGGFLFAGAHGSVSALNGEAKLQGEVGAVAQYDSRTGFSTSALLEGGTPFASVGVEAGYNWTQGKWAVEPFLFGGPAPSPGSEVPDPFANEKTGFDLGEMGAGLLITPDSEIGGYVQLGPLAAGAYAKPSFLGKNSCAHH